MAKVFGALGLQPAGDDGTFFQTFPFTAGVSLDATNVLTVRTAQGDRTLTVDSDWRPLAFSRTGALDAAGVVFAGYGIVAPPRANSQPMTPTPTWMSPTNGY